MYGMFVVPLKGDRTMKYIRRLGVLLLVIGVVGVAGCGLNPKAERTPDGFNPPYNYY